MDTHLCRNSDIAGRIAHTGEHGIGKGEQDATLCGTVPIAHVLADGEVPPGPLRGTAQ